MPKLTAEYHFTVPEILIVGETLPNLQPMKLSLNIGNVTIYPPEGENRVYKPDELWNANSLRVVQEVELSPSLNEEEKNRFLTESRKTIEELISRFLRLLRRQLQISMSLPTSLPCSTNFQWKDLSSNQPIIVARLYGGTIRVVEQGSGLTEGKWAKLQEGISSGMDTELWEDFIEDSKAALDSMDLNRATIYAAIASEIFIKEYTEKAATKANIPQNFWDYLISPKLEISIVDYYDNILLLVVGHSMKAENKESYDLLDRISKARNRIVHTGTLSYSEKQIAQLVGDIRGEEQALSWVRGLPSVTKS